VVLTHVGHFADKVASYVGVEDEPEKIVLAKTPFSYTRSDYKPFPYSFESQTRKQNDLRLEESAIIFKIFIATAHSVHMNLQNDRFDGNVCGCRLPSHVFHRFQRAELLRKEILNYA
jgi:hypothetical protein